MAEHTMSLENLTLYVFLIDATSAVSSCGGSKKQFSNDSAKKKGM